MTDRRRAFDPGPLLFRHRGLVPVLPIVFALVAADPRAPFLVPGMVLMAAGESVRLWSSGHLGLIARSSTARAVKLVTSGPYARTRHPLYWGNFCLTLGFCLTAGAGIPWFPALAAAGFVILYAGHARREERILARTFPDRFRAYRERVPAVRWRLRPAAVPAAGETGSPSPGRALRVEALSLNAEFWLLAALWARNRWLPPWYSGQG